MKLKKGINPLEVWNGVFIIIIILMLIIIALKNIDCPNITGLFVALLFMIYYHMSNYCLINTRKVKT